ncbi:hypothetical protein CSPX01_02204 [Colletotrichum filicis]|nr:hypothetical protein CSPX01_02204 [Colletotrichum filicis]
MDVDYLYFFLLLLLLPVGQSRWINQCVSQFSGFPVCGLPMSDGTHLSMSPIVSFRAASSSGDAERSW